MRRFLFVSVLSVSVGFPVPGSTEIYRCTGSTGEPLFSQIPCGGAATVLVRPPLASEPAQGLRAGEKAWLAQRAEHRKGRVARAGSGVPSKGRASQDGAAVQAHRCLRKRRDLNAVNARLRRGYKPSQGEKLRQRRQRYEDYLSSFCD